MKKAFFILSLLSATSPIICDIIQETQTIKLRVGQTFKPSFKVSLSCGTMIHLEEPLNSDAIILEDEGFTDKYTPPAGICGGDHAVQYFVFRALKPGIIRFSLINSKRTQRIYYHVEVA